MRARTIPLSEGTNARVSAVVDAYPPDIRERVLQLRQLVLDTAEERAELGCFAETLKWGATLVDPDRLCSSAGLEGVSA